MNRLAVTLAVILFTALSTPAHAAKKATGYGPCTGASQCADNLCVELNGNSYCSRACGTCPGGMYCDEQLFAAVGWKVCVKGASDQPVQPKEPPELPCSSDKECTGGMVCAKMMGHRDCALTCSSDAECQMPEMVGVKFDFLACQKDEGKPTRMACLPKKACLANPASCISVNPQAMAGAMQGMTGMAQGMANAMGGSEAEPPNSDKHFPGGEAAPVTRPAPAPAAAAPKAMAEGPFSALIKQIRDTGFDDEREQVITTAAKHNYFTCDQIGRVVDELKFGDERVAAVRVLAPRRVDKENSHTILSHFTFDDEKRKASAFLED